jgi:sugar O-acyltransferase (sialic acid O-acetyltransferase NeuD family)
MKKKLLILGAGGHGKVLADIALRMNSWQSIAFLDDNINSKYSMGIEVIGKLADAINYLEDYDFFVGIGNNQIRERLHVWLDHQGASITLLIHPKSVIGSQVDMNVGTAIMAQVAINCCTKIGKGVIVNTGATIDHDNVIEDYVHISPGAHLAGNVRIKKGTNLGIGSIVSNNINITSECIIGAGAVVVKDITEVGTYVGIPARRLIQ